MINTNSNDRFIVRMPFNLRDHAESIADLALEICEEKLFETRRRNRRSPPTQPCDPLSENPFLSRLGSPFLASRSIHGRRNNEPTDNIHPLKAPRTRTMSTIKTSSDSDDRERDQASLRKMKRILTPLDAPSYALFLFFLALILVPKGLMTMESRLFEWHRLSDRHLNGRHCVLNFFIDKHKADEFSPDQNAKDQFLLDTYRTKGQMLIITRLISCVADSFRNNLKVVQHIVFAGSRDGGHLAQEALIHWPARGVHRTTLHVFADGDSKDALAYENIAAMENRFTTFNDFIHLYDSKGNIAGKTESASEDDDGLPEKEKRIPETNLETGDFQTLLWDEDDVEGDTKTIVPYFHVDGTSMASQLALLNKASSLFESHTVAVVGLEHSPDMNISDIVNFFRALKYKIFMLGLRQLSRIDNLCPETLENLLDHPHISHHDGIHIFGEKQAISPPFFVAMPAGRHGLEEMTIQHMYDLFSGLGGGGQVKTANDRKAPGKK
jgi:hypothetical protein